jgi:hypothetical protein
MIDKSQLCIMCAKLVPKVTEPHLNNRMHKGKFCSRKCKDKSKPFRPSRCKEESTINNLADFNKYYGKK